MPQVKINGIELYYELHGPEDGEVLVLSNGILMSTASWGLQTPILSKRYRVLLYDCRGMWKSEHPKGPYTMELHAEDLAALLDELNDCKSTYCRNFLWRRSEHGICSEISGHAPSPFSWLRLLAN